jgi:hypothetical protein
MLCSLLVLNLVGFASSTFYISRTDGLPDAMDSHCVFYDEYDGIDATFFLHAYSSYCFRLDVRSKDAMFASASKHGLPSSRTSFGDLEKRHVTVSELLATAIIPMDDIERYQSYLLGHDTNETKDRYLFICPIFHFGTFCQFEFPLFAANLSLGKILKYYFDTIYVDIGSLDLEKVLTNVPCYTHLQCGAAAGSNCLDWREICNGVRDCFDSNVDEENCFELELTECASDEYRCHNGMQCIPTDFLRDTHLLPDCLDKSDETIDHVYNDQCFEGQRLHCAEFLCAPGLMSCADGRCIEFKCQNRRHDIYIKVLFSQSPNMSNACWNAMGDMLPFNGSSKQLITSNNLQKAQRLCPPILEYPAYPVANGDARLIFNLDKPMGIRWLMPNSICYNATLCPFLSPTELTYLNYSSCRSFQHKSDSMSTLPHFLFVIRAALAACAMVDQFRFADRLESANLYRCRKTNKYIAQSRILDGIADCWHKDDENVTESCSLQPVNGRFTCDEHPSTHCFSPLMLHRQGFRCSRSSFDRSRSSLEPINFQTLCDGFEDRAPMLIDGRNQTDETDCPPSSCNTTYTHCNHYWNCPNGLDELGCYRETIDQCGRSAHRCLKPSEKGWMCLNLSRADDGYVDCRGGMDERLFCRSRYKEQTEVRYSCSSKYGCLSLDEVCSHFKVCDIPLVNTDTCRSHWYGFEPFSLTYPCSPRYDPRRSQHKNYLCLLDEQDKPKVVYFSLNSKKTNQSKAVELPDMIPVVQAAKDVHYRDTIDSILMRGLCHRGFPGYLRNTSSVVCLCSPDSYGDRCQYQNERVLVTVQFWVEADLHTVFAVLFLLVDPESGEVESHEPMHYLPIRDCRGKFTFHLLYHTRPKRPRTDYFVRIEVFDADNLHFRDSWIYSLPFSFLPVHRLAIQVFIPAPHSASSCSLNCGEHGRCTRYTNNVNNVYCRCNTGWSGASCTKRFSSRCAPTSLCVGFSLSTLSPICVCPVGWFGSRCYLQHSACVESPCLHKGRCVPNDGHLLRVRSAGEGAPFRCLCPEDRSGNVCQYNQSRIQLDFDDVPDIPQFVLVHLITVSGESHPSVMSMIVKVPYDQNSVVFYTSVIINLIFIVHNNAYHLLFRHGDPTPSRQLQIDLSSSARCWHINQIFTDRTILALHPLHRAKYYHSACRKHPQLTCFHDSDTFMCLCNAFDRNADCFNFDHTTERNCRDSKYCLNGGQCSQDHPTCPTRSLCSCAECFYGRRCQFSTSGLGLSLDAILGYHIQTSVPFTRQPLAVRISGLLVAALFAVGLVGNVLALLTFSSPTIRKTGCGIYLFASSSTALLIIVLLALKFTWLFLTQSGSITDYALLQGTCVASLDFVIRVCLSIVGWSNACVAIERYLIVSQGLGFKKKRNYDLAKGIVVIILLVTISTAIHDPLHRNLLQDTEERRTWCTVTYSPRLQTFDSAMLFAHFLIPFCINLGSALWIILILSLNPSLTQKKRSFYDRLVQQLRDHKRLLISCWTLVILALPRLIIALQMGCLKSQRDPYLSLCAYFISFMPPALVFFVFIVPSSAYMLELRKRIRCFR